MRILLLMQFGDDRSQRWLARSRAGFFVSSLAIVIPIALSVAVAYGVSDLLPTPTSRAWQVLWWACVLIAAWLAVALGERLVRPLLPLASLLKMSLLFPDHAPSRFSVAWKAGSTRQLDRYVHGSVDAARREPLSAAIEILALVTSLSSHDRRTRGHSERVRAYTDLIADEMKLPAEVRDRLRWASLLHDVGKLSVNTEILNKDGAPSAEEWEILRGHPLEGGRMIEPIREWLGPWGLAVEQHHENYDGSGYPYGLSGNEISLGARIVSVADAFEVMTAVRSYKSSMSPLDARKELTRCAGGQFDPAVVRAFLNISIGKQRWIIGPMAFLFDVPVVSQIGNLGNVLVTTSQVALVAGSMTIAAVASGGNASVHVESHSAASAVATVLRGETVAMDVSSSRVHVAGTVRATAKIADVRAKESGAVTYYVYNNGTCSKADGGRVATLGPVAANDGNVAGSASWTAPSTGTFYFVAVYRVEPNGSAAWSKCGARPVQVMAQDPTFASQLSSDSVVVGATVADNTALVGGTTDASGFVTIDVYDNDACSKSNSGLVAALGPAPVVNGAVSKAPIWVAATPGTYYLVAVYSGDANNVKTSSGCASEPVKVNSGVPPPTAPSQPAKSPPPTTPPAPPTPPTPPAPPAPPAPPPTTPTTPTTPSPTSPSITTQLSSNSVSIGGSLHDGSTLSGATSSAGGTVSYDVYSNSTCASAGLVSTLGPVTVSAGVVPDSPTWTATSAGTFYFVALYSGDANNNATSSACAAEAVTVSPTSPSITTQLSPNTVVFGESADVNAVITGVTPTAGGTVSYDVYSNNTCSGSPYVVGSVSVINGVTSGALSQTILAFPGVYYYVAVYSGDADNAGAQSGCASAPLTVL